jgi:hypothetical protein
MGWAKEPDSQRTGAVSFAFRTTGRYAYAGSVRSEYERSKCVVT